MTARPRIAELAGLSEAQLAEGVVACARLQGACAAILGQGTADNPHPRGGAARRAWAEGLAEQAETELKRRLADERIPTRRVLHVKQRPGRGHGRCGPRSEWPEALKAAAWDFRHQLSHARIGALIGKSEQAVTMQFHRMGLEGEG